MGLNILLLEATRAIKSDCHTSRLWLKKENLMRQVTARSALVILYVMVLLSTTHLYYSCVVVPLDGDEDTQIGGEPSDP